MFRDAELWGDAGGLPGGGSAELGPAGWMGWTGMGEQRGSVGEWVGAGTAQAEPQKWAEAGLGDMASGAESEELPAITPQNETDPPRHRLSGKRQYLLCTLPPLGPCPGVCRSLPLWNGQHRGSRSGAPFLSVAGWLQRVGGGLRQPCPLGSFGR